MQEVVEGQKSMETRRIDCGPHIVDNHISLKISPCMALVMA